MLCLFQANSSKKLQRTLSTKVKVELTFAIICKDEERTISRCIESIIDYADKVIVVDTGSTDNTRKIIENFNSPKIDLYNLSWTNDFSAPRNFAISKCNSDWIFFIDSDEYLVPNQDITNILNQFNDICDRAPVAFCPKIINHDDSEIIGVRRIFRLTDHLHFYGVVHEEPRTKNNDYVYYISIDIQVLHDGYLPKIQESKNKSVRNLTLDKKMIQLEPHNNRWRYFYFRDSIDGSYNKDLEVQMLDYLFTEHSDELIYENFFCSEFSLPILILLLGYSSLYNQFLFKKLLIFSEQNFQDNPDIFYYSSISKLLDIVTQRRQLLQNTVKFRKQKNIDYYGSLHSKGYQIDFLLGLLLAENGQFTLSKKYLNLVHNKFNVQNLEKIYFPN